MRKLPSWMASILLHAALALLLSLIVLTAAAMEPDPVVGLREHRRSEARMKPMTAAGPLAPIAGTPDAPEAREFAPEAAPDSDAPGRRDAERSGATWHADWTRVSVAGPGGGGGRFPGRGQGRGAAARAGGGGDDTERAVLAGLLWLARHQGDDGSWSVQGHAAKCRGPKCAPHPGAEEHQPGVTGLALLAFLGAGYSHLSTEVHEGIRFADVVKRGLQWIVTAHEKRAGPFVPLYSHFLASMALSEAYGLTGSERLLEPAQAMVDEIVRAQNRYAGWRYTPRTDNDASLTGMAVLALKSAEWSGLAVPGHCWFEAKGYLDEVTESGPYVYRVGYLGRRSVNDVPKSAGFRLHASMTALGMAAHLMQEGRAAERKVAPGAGPLLDDPPAIKPDDRDYFYWYYGSLAMFQLDGPDGRRWRKWNDELKGALLPTQNGDDRGCRRGSWEPDDYWSLHGGRVYATAIGCLTLEVYYRYPLAFGVRENK